MNKFVRQYLILPFVVVFCLFPLLFLLGCGCATVNPGNKVQVIASKQNTSTKETEPLSRENKLLFQKIVWLVGHKWLIDREFGKRSILQEKLQKELSKSKPEKKKIIQEFIQAAFKSEKNTRYYKAEFISKVTKIHNKVEWAQEFWADDKKKSKEFSFALFFQNDDSSKKRKVIITIKKFIMKKTGGEFDLGNDFSLSIIRL